MRVADLRNKNVVVWGTGKEGLATANLLCAHLPGQPFSFIDEGQGPESLQIAGNKLPVLRDAGTISKALSGADVVIKSPGVSLYHPLLEQQKARGLAVTSLLNLWLAEKKSGVVIGISGTKGKSTTATLLNHVLNGIGKKSVVLGNIGTPVTNGSNAEEAFYVVEISSYQAANLTETLDVGVLVSLYPEHLDWHRNLAAYYKDKANLLVHSKQRIIEPSAAATLEGEEIAFNDAIRFGLNETAHFNGTNAYCGSRLLGHLENAFLQRNHNQSNVCAVLQVIDVLGLDTQAALQAMKSYEGLPHRQHELGEKNGILFVDDSISTTPQSSIAAMVAYEGRPLTLIAGGFDRGIDYLPLVEYVVENKVNAIVCLGQSGKRISEALRSKGARNVVLVSTMREAVREARQLTPPQGVILLSPAAPSYDMFKDHIERADVFAKECGF